MELFGTAGIRGPARDRVTPELALSVGRAVARDADEVVLGRDGRTTGAGLAAAMASGLMSGGTSVRRAGVVPTPALAFATQDRHGVMVTASHNPPADNGIKLFENGSEYDRERERAIETRVDTGDEPANWDEWADAERIDVLPAYREAVVDYARRFGAPLDGLRVVVDCGNGVGALATPQVLRALGADVDALNANVDGHFPGRESKPTPETLVDQRAFLREADADLGIAHDGDADRIVVLDQTGDVIHEDTILAVLAEHYVRESDVDDPVVVTTPNASARIDERVRAAGGRIERVRLGALHEGIARVQLEGNEETSVVFAAEPWKHIHPAWGGWIDGVVSAAVISRLVAELGGLDSLTASVTERPYRKISINCPDERKETAMELIGERLPDTVEDATLDTQYGVRAELPDASWVLIRPSGTEPYVRVYAESNDVDDLVDRAVEVVEGAIVDIGE